MLPEAVVSLLLALMFACGTERWTVNVLYDPGATGLSLAPHLTTVTAVNGTAPHTVGLHTPRLTGLETTLWDLRAVVCLVKPETDEDRHVVIADAPPGCQPPGQGFVGPTMIAESPSSTCSARSHFGTKVRATRAVVASRHPGDHVHVAGPGFQDFDHNQTGRARSGIEIHSIRRVLP
jgi:hypothetical protein